MVNTALTKEKLQEREDRIIQHFSKYPFVGERSMYSEGTGIPNYNASKKIFHRLVDENKIRVLHSKRGEPKYYVPRDWMWQNENSNDHRFPLLNYHCQEIQYQLSEFSNDNEDFAGLVQQFSILVEYRYKIFLTEIKNRHEPNIKLLEKDISTLELFLLYQGVMLELPRWKGIEGVKGIIFQNQTVEEMISYFQALCEFSNFFLHHQAHAFGGKEKRFRHVFTGARHAVHKKLQMKTSRDNSRWAIKKEDYKKAIQPITNGNATDYEEVFNRLSSERQSILTDNPEFAVYAHMLAIIYAEMSYKRNARIQNLLHQWFDIILEVAVKRLENKILGNLDAEVVIYTSHEKIKYTILNDMSNLGEEMENKKTIMFAALSGEFQE